MIFVTFRLISPSQAVVKEGASAVESFLPSECQGVSRKSTRHSDPHRMVTLSRLETKIST